MDAQMNEGALLKAVCSMKHYPEPFLLAEVRLSLEATKLLLIAYHNYFPSAVILALVHLVILCTSCERCPVQSFFRLQRGAGFYVQKAVDLLSITVYLNAFSGLSLLQVNITKMSKRD